MNRHWQLCAGLLALLVLSLSCGEQGEGGGGRGSFPDPFAFRDDSRLLLTIPVDEPIDMAVGEEDGILCVGGRGARLFDREGKVIRSWLCPFPPRAVTPGAGGTFWIAGADRVGRWSAAGEELAQWQLAPAREGVEPLVTGLARVGASLFFADAAGRCVHRYAVDGDFINLVGEDAGPKGLMIPSPYFSVCAAADGTLWLTHTGMHRVCRYSLDGSLLGQWGRRGMGPGAFGGCCNPVGLALFPDGRVVTAEKGLGRISLYTGEGELLALVGSRRVSRSARGLKVAVDSKGRILVLDPPVGKILVFAPGGGQGGEE